MKREQFNELYRRFLLEVVRASPRTDATRNRVYFLFGTLKEKEVRTVMNYFYRAVKSSRIQAGEEPEPGKWAFAIQECGFTVHRSANWYCEKMGYSLPSPEEQQAVSKEAARVASLFHNIK